MRTYHLILIYFGISNPFQLLLINHRIKLVTAIKIKIPARVQGLNYLDLHHVEKSRYKT